MTTIHVTLTMRCHLCPEVVAADDLAGLVRGTADHVRLMHPDEWDGEVTVDE